MPVQIPLYLGDDYSGDLKRRLEKYGISHGELARRTGIDPSQLSRWFNTPLQPSQKNVVRIELAILEIRASQRKAKKGTKRGNDA